MSNRGLHLLGSPLLSPFAAMPQLYSTPQRSGSAASGGSGARSTPSTRLPQGSPEESPIHHVSGASPQGILHTTAGCPLTPLSQGRQQDTPVRTAPKTRRARILSPPLHPSFKAARASPVAAALTSSFESLHSLGSSPSPPSAGPQHPIHSQAEAARSGEGVSIALDFSDSTSSFGHPVGAANVLQTAAASNEACSPALHAEAAIAGTVPSGASPVLDPVTGAFLGYFISSPQLHMSSDAHGLQADTGEARGSPASRSGGASCQHEQLSSLLPLVDMPSGSAYNSMNLSVHSSASAAPPSAGRRQHRVHPNSPQLHKKAKSQEPCAADTIMKRQSRSPHRPGAWMSHYLGSLSSPRAASPATKRRPQQASHSPYHSTSSPLQRRQVKSEWWGGSCTAAGGSPTAKAHRTLASSSPGDTWRDELYRSAHTTGQSGKHKARWSAVSVDAEWTRPVASSVLHPALNFGSAVKEGRAYGLSEADIGTYASLIHRSSATGIQASHAISCRPSRTCNVGASSLSFGVDHTSSHGAHFSQSPIQKIDDSSASFASSVSNCG